jgi:hypothetical protein
MSKAKLVKKVTAKKTTKTAVDKATTAKPKATKTAKSIKSKKLTFKEYNERRVAFVNQIDEINNQIDKLEIELLNSNALQGGQIVTVQGFEGEFVVVQVQRKFNANLVAVKKRPDAEIFEGAIDNVSQNDVCIEVLLREITSVVV